jgi:hypothetical protein
VAQGPRRAALFSQLNGAGETETPRPTVPTTGMMTPGTITNVYDRKVLFNPDGSQSTMSSESANFGGVEVLYPTVIDGKRLSSRDAQDHYLSTVVDGDLRTGQHLGIFDTPEHATAYSKALSDSMQRTLTEADTD